MTTNLPQLYLLPGFHGSATLFEPLIKALGDSVEAYPFSFTPCDSIAQHAENISLLLPDEGGFLLAESFSGLIALYLAAQKPQRFRGLILSASFAVTPLRFFTRLGSYLPAGIYSPNPLRKLLIDTFCLNDIHDEQLTRQVLTAINEVSPSTVKQRINVLASTDLTALLSNVETPVLLLEASKDRVVPPNRVNTLLAGLPNARRQRIDGPHLILQTKPREAAAAVRNFIASFQDG
ncbi:MAG: alpha/beta fold hydrolase [Gammaproteobacteria bacterium]